VEAESAVFSGDCVDCCLGGSLKLENFGITGVAVDDIAEGQVKSREHVVGVVWFILAPSLAFLRHEQFVVTTIEIGVRIEPSIIFSTVHNYILRFKTPVQNMVTCTLLKQSLTTNCRSKHDSSWRIDRNLLRF
jgi:hypothetical protein